MPEMNTTLHVALRRSPMPAALPLSGLIKWMHDRIKAHRDSARRWRERNPELAKICASNLYYQAKPLKTGLYAGMPLADKRKAKAEYMRNYRASIAMKREGIAKKIRKTDWETWKAKKEAEGAKRKAKWLRRQRKRGLV